MKSLLTASLAALALFTPLHQEEEQVGLRYHLKLAESALDSGDLERAREFIQNALERDRKSRDAWALRSRWAQIVKDTDERVFAAHRELALAEAQGAPKKEIDELRDRVEALDPLAADLFGMKADFRERLLSIAKKYEKAGRHHAAIRTFKRILILNPEDAESQSAIERIAATPDPSLAGDAKPKDLFEDVSREWIEEFDATHDDWDSRGKLERENYNTHSDAGYEVLVRSAEAMEQMNAFYRVFFRYGTEEHGGSVPRIDLRIFKDRDEYLELGTGPPAEWSGGQFTGSAVETYVGSTGFEGMVGTLFHEAAHQFVALATTATGWLNEGLASFFEGTRILANGTVIMNMPANHRLFPLATRMERGWMSSYDDGADGSDPNQTPETAPTFRIILEDEYTWGPPWYAPTWGVVYFLYNYQDLADGRFVYRDAFQVFIDSSGGRSGKGAVENFVEVVLGNPKKPYRGVPAELRKEAPALPKTIEQLDAVWKEWILELRDEQRGQLARERNYLNWGKFAAENRDYEVAAEHFERGLVAQGENPELLLAFADLLAGELDNRDRAAKLVLDALRVLESAESPDEDAIRRAEKKLAKYDPKFGSLAQVQEQIALAARSLIKRYQSSGNALMTMDLAWRMGSELEIPELFETYREAFEASGKSLRIWELAYNERDLSGWQSSGSTSFRPDGTQISIEKGTYDPENFDYEMLTLDRVTSGDFSMQAEWQANAGEVSFCGFVFGRKSSDSFHALALFPGKAKKQEGLADTNFVELFSFYGGDPKTWRRVPVPKQKQDGRSSTAVWHELRLDVIGTNADLWLNGKFLATHEFPSRDVLFGNFGLITGLGKAKVRNVRFLAMDARDPASQIERDLRMKALRAASAGSLGGSFLGVVPPFPQVDTWIQGERKSWSELGPNLQLLVFFSTLQNDLVRIDEWLYDLGKRGARYGLEVVAIASANDKDSLAAYLKTHKMPGAIGVDSREGFGIGTTFDQYSIPRFNLPRLILLDVDHRVAWEGDPGFSTAAPWQPGTRATIEDALDELVKQRGLKTWIEWRIRWLEQSRSAIEAGDMAALAPLLLEARSLDPKLGAEAEDARQLFESLEATILALESTAASWERKGTVPALPVLLEWAELLGVPVPEKLPRATKKIMNGSGAKAWKAAVRAATRLAKRKEPGPEHYDEVLATLAAEQGLFIRELESELRSQLESGNLEGFRDACGDMENRPLRWLTSELLGSL